MIGSPEVVHPGDGMKTDLGEEALNLIEPARVRRDEVRSPTGMAHQPFTHRFCLVRAVVVDDDVDGEFRRS